MSDERRKSAMKRLLIIIFILVFPFFAYAEDLEGWDKTNWQMTGEEVVLLYKDRIINIIDNAGVDKRIYLNGSIDAGMITISPVLVIKDNRLVEVRLESGKGSNSDSVYNSIKTLLIQKYNKPDTEENNSSGYGSFFLFSKIATWFKGKTTIQLNVLDNNGVVRYMPAKNINGL